MVVSKTARSPFYSGGGLDVAGGKNAAVMYDARLAGSAMTGIMIVMSVFAFQYMKLFLFPGNHRYGGSGTYFLAKPASHAFFRSICPHDQNRPAAIGGRKRHFLFRIIDGEDASLLPLGRNDKPNHV